ncbi:glycine cleavage system protein GcvH [Lignipirellula cremea]|uniref:Glycine cleavage system H protein n=1 Tax=Lignipirellula cremea TaxID=2528010 RepID=A0A518DY46_9BACT|nr:glycine cleavage system protein GcvH [Lignipirellula cremea]QDU96715.1 Glycine cleavage system H protein [Lignipirellula cremea]
MKPEDLLYRESHEWAAIEEEGGSKIATIGISAFAVEQLTDITYLALPQIGKQVAAGEEIGELESVKAIASIYSPVTGEVIAVNETLPEKLELLNDDAYNDGWVAKIRVTDDSSLSGLLDYAAYTKQCQEG